MLTAVVHQLGDASFDVHLMADEDDEETTGEQIDETLAEEEGPSPIAPEMKELLWGLGAFLVFLAVMRLWLVPKVKRGMDARYGKIRGQLEEADAVRIEAARHELDGERTEQLAAVNARIAERRGAAAAQAEEAKAAQRESVEAAAADVAARIAELATGRRPDEAVVRRAVSESVHAGVGR